MAFRDNYAPREPKAQELRYVARIQRRSEDVDAMGTPLNIWTTQYTVRASVAPTDGKEFEASSATQALTTVLITIRGGITVRAKDRVIVNNTWYEIRSIVNAGLRNRWLYLTCDEQVEPPVADDSTAVPITWGDGDPVEWAGGDPVEA